MRKGGREGGRETDIDVSEGKISMLSSPIIFTNAEI